MGGVNPLLVLFRYFICFDFDFDIQSAATLPKILGDSAVFVFLVAESEIE